MKKKENKRFLNLLMIKMMLLLFKEVRIILIKEGLL